MERERMIACRFFRSADGVPMTVSYRLLESPDRIARYGIAVERRAPDGVQRETARAISPRADVVRALIGRLADGLVTPCTLRDVLEDLLAENPDFLGKNR